MGSDGGTLVASSPEFLKTYAEACQGKKENKSSDSTMTPNWASLASSPIYSPEPGSSYKDKLLTNSKPPVPKKPKIAKKPSLPSKPKIIRDCPIKISWTPKPLLLHSMNDLTIIVERKLEWRSEEVGFEVAINLTTTDHTFETTYEKRVTFAQGSSSSSENVVYQLDHLARASGQVKLEVVDIISSKYDFKLPNPKQMILTIEDDSPRFQHQEPEKILDRGKLECGFDSDHNLLVLGVI